MPQKEDIFILKNDCQNNLPQTFSLGSKSRCRNLVTEILPVDHPESGVISKEGLKGQTVQGSFQEPSALRSVGLAFVSITLFTKTLQVLPCHIPLKAVISFLLHWLTYSVSKQFKKEIILILLIPKV